MTAVSRYYKSLFQVWHIGDPSGIALNDACADYIGQLKNVAVNMSPLYFVVTLIPCARLWPWLGKEISGQPRSINISSTIWWLKVPKSTYFYTM
ncbi:hypothetical protein CHS0354_020955 [Potamilus streckersoni]|uniref:Uncharacterized protein n=1 Tax=Potamilus streckersoni TaxID=2493646 RepID=A0AAE0VTA2_9BIVA|nr:hypothetical protein CHS0354_020955 [Potamilus streckersoni]